MNFSKLNLKQRMKSSMKEKVISIILDHLLEKSENDNFEMSSKKLDQSNWSYINKTLLF